MFRSFHDLFTLNNVTITNLIALKSISILLVEKASGSRILNSLVKNVYSSGGANLSIKNSDFLIENSTFVSMFTFNPDSNLFVGKSNLVITNSLFDNTFNNMSFYIEE